MAVPPVSAVQTGVPVTVTPGGSASSWANGGDEDPAGWEPVTAIDSGSSVVLRSTETVAPPGSEFEYKFAVIRSGLPSPSTSPTATEYGPAPVPKSVLLANEPEPSPRSTDTVSAPSFVSARSGWPSPFRSLTATGVGVAPVRKSP